MLELSVKSIGLCHKDIECKSLIFQELWKLIHCRYSQETNWLASSLVKLVVDKQKTKFWHNDMMGITRFVSLF